jgi:hypothetical protein
VGRRRSAKLTPDPVSRGLGPLKSGGLVAQTVTKWNQIVSWLQEVDMVRRTGGLREGEPHSARAVSGSGASEQNRTPVPGGTGAAESHRRAGASAGSRIDHGSRCDLRHQGWDAGPTGILRQLSDRQSQLRNRGSTQPAEPQSDSGTCGRSHYGVRSGNVPGLVEWAPCGCARPCRSGLTTAQ